MKQGINKVNPKSVMTFGVQLACIWNRTPSVFPGKDEMPPGIFLTKLFLENEGVVVPGVHWYHEPLDCLCCLTLQFGDPPVPPCCSRDESGLGQELPLARRA